MQARRPTRWVLTAIGGLCLGAAAVGLSQQRTALTLPPPAAAPAPEDLSVAFREIAQRALPAVVSITTVIEPRRVEQDQQRPSPMQERFFREFFGDDPRFQEMFRNRERQIPRRQGMGSGFIVHEDGIILTNSHVIEGADRVQVRLDDGREIMAESWHFDPRSDVAIVRINVDEKLPFLTLGDSERMQVGDWVVALGNPFQIGTTVTVGIISATGRGPGILEREGFLQTDAAINPGNSGGPLVNLHGEVIGLNTAISSRSGGYEGIGFAITSRTARWAAEHLIEHGEVKRAYLGVALQSLTPELREQLNVPQGTGALVADVRPDSPAAKAEFQPGDVILDFAGQEIIDSERLVDVVERSSLGQVYDVVVLRGGAREKLQVRLEAMPGDYTPALARRRPRESPQEQQPPPREIEVERFGIEIAEHNRELAEQLGTDPGLRGVVVTNVHPDTPAARGGLQPGDVIQRVGRTPVRTVDEFREAAEAANLEQGILLHIKRGSGSAFVVLKSES